MGDLALLLVLTMAVGAGWLLGRWQQHRQDSQPNPASLPAGINYLLDEVPDSALNTFLKALDVNSDTLETHLALGSIHRRRGEVDRAILIHENLAARKELSRVQRHYAQLELALDYCKAGLLDRAELSLQTLVETSAEYRQTALRSLLDIYQDEKEWRKAINVCNLLVEDMPSGDRHQFDRLRSHFYCEIAEECQKQADFLGARRALDRAVFYDVSNHRSRLIEAGLELQLENPERARRVLTALVNRTRSYPEGLLPVARRVFAVQGDNSDYHDWLEQLYPRFPVPEMLIELARQKSGLWGDKAAADFLLREVRTRPSFEGLAHLVSVAPETAGDAGPILRVLLGVSEATQPVFQCQHCGFEGKQWHWRCPGCKHWDSLVPNTLPAESLS